MMPKMPQIVRSRVFIAIVGLVLILVALRIALPNYLLNYVNRTIDRMEDYSGRVADIDVSLLRGAYTIKGLKLLKTGGKVPVPFLEIERIDLSLQWSELIHGSLVGEMALINPKMNFVKGPTKETSQSGLGQSWIEVTQDLFPFSLNRLDVFNAEVHYRDFHSDPEIDVYLDKIYAVAENLTNSRSMSEEKFASVVIRNKPGKGDPEVEVKVDLDTFEEAPTFDLRFSLKKLDLRRLNKFFTAYGKFDVEKGEFSLYSEIVSAGGAYKGYVRPLFKDMEVLNLKKDMKNPFQAIWEAIVGAVSGILESKPTDRVATQIPIRGNYKEKNIDYWAAIGNLLRNAFIEAIRPGFEGITEGKVSGAPGREKEKKGKG